MVKKTVLSLVCTTALLASEHEVEQLKKQMAQLQQQLYEMQQQIKVLEKQSLKEEPNKVESAQAVTSAESSLAHAPEIELVLNGGYTSRNISNYNYSNGSIPGFIDAGNMEIPFNAKNGFNFNYADVGLSAEIDPALEASAIFHIHGDGTLEIEEAYIISRALDYGFGFKAGKLKSAFGKSNEQHHHTWNFEDKELINFALFGIDGLGGQGAQLQWTAPTPFYLMSGVELFNGNPNQGFSAKESATTAVGYLKIGTDIGEGTLLSGISYAQGKSEIQNIDGFGNLIPDSFSDYGQTRLYGADVTFEYPLDGYGALTWQNEWIQRNKDAAAGVEKQAGYYSELLYQFNDHWAMGVRYDEIYKNETTNPLTSIEHLNRTSAKLEYKPFESSRFRLQYNQDHSKYVANNPKTLHEVIVNYTIEIGGHEAHTTERK